MPTVYFSPSGAGAQTGADPANAKAAISGGAWAAAINNDLGNGNLVALLAGTYASTTALNPGATSSLANPIAMVGCDAAGATLQPRRLRGGRGRLDASAMPRIELATGLQMWTSAKTHTLLHGLVVTGSVSNPLVNLSLNCSLTRCCIINAGSGTSVSCANPSTWGAVADCDLEVTSGTYNAVLALAQICQVRGCTVLGPGKGVAGSGNRRGIASAFGFYVNNCYVAGVAGEGLHTTHSESIVNCSRMTVRDVGGDGIAMINASINPHRVVTDSVIVGCGGWGINCSTAGAAISLRNRMRNNTSGNLNGHNAVMSDSPLTEAMTDAEEFADLAGGDFGLRPSSPASAERLGGSGLGWAPWGLARGLRERGR